MDNAGASKIVPTELVVSVRRGKIDQLVKLGECYSIELVDRPVQCSKNFFSFGSRPNLDTINALLLAIFLAESFGATGKCSVWTVSADLASGEAR